jgi:TonB family protein
MHNQRLSLTLMMMGLAAMPLLAQDTVRRLTQEEAVKAAVAKPQPDYPPVARQLRIQGRIEMEISIDPSGSVENVKVVTGNPALTGTALSTLKHWRFEPILSGGKPARAVAVMSFTFKL